MDHQPTVTTQATPVGPTRGDLRIKVFADGADLESIRLYAADPTISGFTTNPTLMRKAGVTDYEAFAKAALELVGDRPISFEVFSDDPTEMVRQGRKIASWGDGVYVKVPVTTTDGTPTGDVQRELAHDGVKLNVTALFTNAQVADVAANVAGGAPCVVSVFAGRVADAGVDPIPLMRAAVEQLEELATAELLWASPREVLNIVQADDVGCDIVTVTADLLAKLPSLGKSLEEFSLDTVKMFHRDGEAAGYRL